VKKMRPSGANPSETGKLRPVRRALTGETAWAGGNMAGLRNKRARRVVFLSTL